MAIKFKTHYFNSYLIGCSIIKIQRSHAFVFGWYLLFFLASVEISSDSSFGIRCIENISELRIAWVECTYSVRMFELSAWKIINYNIANWIQRISLRFTSLIRNKYTNLKWKKWTSTTYKRRLLPRNCRLTSIWVEFHFAEMNYHTSKQIKKIVEKWTLECPSQRK